MKINPSSEKPAALTPQPASASAKSAPSVSAQAQSAAANGTRTAGVAVTVSSLVRALAPNAAADLAEVDQKKVQDVRAAIADGTYVVNPEAIADKMLANAQEMLQRQRV